MDTHWFSSSKRGVTGLAGKGVRIASALFLLTLTFGPLPDAPLSSPTPVAHASVLDWDDVRPPLSDEGDSNGDDRFRKLTGFGNELHALAVGMNGDIFAAGGTAAGNPTIYKSTDGGMRWREAGNGDGVNPIPAGATINAIAVSATYPGDGFVIVAYSNRDGAGAGATDGIAWSTDGGLTFPNLVAGPDWGVGAMDNIDWRAVALSTDFDSTDDEGSIAIGGVIGGSGGPTNEVQTVTIGGGPTGGSFKLTFQGKTTDAIAFNASAATVDTALEALAVSGDTGAEFTVAGADGGPYTVTFTGGLAGNNVAQMTATSSLTGGTPTITMATTTQGVSLTTGSVFRINTAAFLAADGPTSANWVQLGLDVDGNGALEEVNTNATHHLAYSNDPDGGMLGRLFTGTGGTFGQLLITGTGFQNVGGGNISATAATAGEIAFDDTADFRSGDRWWAAISTGAGCTAPACGVYRFSSGGWENRTSTDTDCNIGFSSVVATGTGSNTRVVAAQDLGARVCRSSNNGSTWSDVQSDGGDDEVDEAAFDFTTAPAVTSGKSNRIASRRSDANLVYHSTAAIRGGVQKSVNNGGGFRDTGLTNNNYSWSGAALDFISDTEVIARVGGSDNRSLWWTNNFGTSAGWVRVFRATDIENVEIPSDFATSKVAWGQRGGTGEERILRSTDGGMSWRETVADPVDDEIINDISARSASTLYAVLFDEGDVYRTTDGGSSWTKLDKDFGRGVDEMDFASETVFFVTAVDNDNVTKVWQTRDGGATFTQLGDNPWGSGCFVSSSNFRLAKYNAEKNEGFGIMMTEEGCNEHTVYRIKIGTDTTWTELKGLNDQEWESVGSFSTPRGDGYALWLYADDDGGCSPCLRYTVVPLTGDVDEFDRDSGPGVNETDNLLMNLPVPPVLGSSMLSRTSADGPQFRIAAATAWMFMTLNKAFVAGPVITSPGNNASVPSNTGDNGIPLTLRWDDIPDANTYEVILGQNLDLSDGAILNVGGTVGARPTSNRMTVLAAVEALTQGSTYYWAVRVIACDVDAGEDGLANNTCESPWSATSSFTVSTTSTQVTTPQPNLPLNGSQLPGLTTELSWNNPPGVTQVHVQITPLNGDGPAINLILGSSTSRYVVPAPVFGTGPYVMLPGASYTWRVRVTGSASPSITETDPAWGPWSEPRSFTTRRPDSGTLQLVGPINGATVSDTTPTLEWKNAAVDEFYYEVQLSADPNFNTNPSTATAAVFHNLLHGGQSTPPNSWTVPDANALKPGSYYWRVRQRLQATPAGSAEVGIAWSPAQRFVVQ